MNQLFQKIIKQDLILKELHPQISDSKKLYEQSLSENNILIEKSNFQRPIFERGLIIENNLNLKTQNLNQTHDKFTKLSASIINLQKEHHEKELILKTIKNNLEITISPLTKLSDHDKTKCSLLYNQLNEKKISTY